MTIKGLSVKVSVEFGLEEMEVTSFDFEALTKAEVASQKMGMLRHSAGEVVDSMSYETKQSLGDVLVDTIAKELGAVIQKQFADKAESDDCDEDTDEESEE